MTEAVAVVVLAAVLAVAVARPRGVPEAAAAVPAAVLLLLIGAVSWSHARVEVDRLGPVVGFLAAVLALADACAGEGLFQAIGAVLARRAGGGSRLLLAVFAAAAVTTAVLSLDTTVVLLTPVVAATAAGAGVRPRPHLYACAHLSNSGSLLLPVSNLTNLLALAVLPLSFLRFAALMALPWLAAVLVELGVFRWFFRRDLAVAAQPPLARPAPVPAFALAVVGATLGGFVVTSLLGVAPVWAAAAGAALLAGKRLLARQATAGHVVRSTAPLFCLFVLALGVVVRAVADGGAASVARHVVPSGSSLPSLLLVAAVAAVAANLLNNLPAVLLLATSARGVGPVLAVLVGVNVGPNLTYVGSLATLLWRRVVSGIDGVPRLAEFTALGLVSVPLTLVAAVTALWLSLHLLGPI